ncbi:MAG: response regulator [Flavobacteriaceae bacterium]|nr:response regulator [Flavobacteriaceae bacterium]
MSLHATENELLIGLQANGLQKLTNNAAFKDFPELEDQTIWKIVPYANDLYWLCTRDSGIILYSISTGIVEAFSTENTSLRTNNIRTIEQHSDYEWWIGSEDAGVYLLDKKSKSVKPIRYTPERIKSLYDDGTYLWIGSNGSGLIAYGIESEEIRSYTKNEGLPNNVIYGILPSGPSQLWVSSNRGLSRFDYNDIDNPLIENYSNYDGLQAFEFNTGAYTKDGNGTLYFGGLEGLNWFNPGDLTFNAALPNTVISSLALFNEDVEMAASHRFKHNENTLTFNYAGLHFSQPERNQYKYRLLEHDADWIDVGNVTSAHYTNLSPGDYEFQVMSSNYDGRWNETPATLQFTISKPWYASNFAFITYALMLMFTAFLVYRYLKWRWEIKMQLQLEHAETERLKKLDEFKTKLYTNISHEFKTPLTLISGPINQQLSKPDLSLDDRSDLNMVKRNSKRLLNLVNQLLDLSKLESGNIKLQVSKGNLSALLNQLVAAFEFKAKEKNIDFNATLKIASEVYFDRDVIEKIVTNLLSNAIKYSPHNGMVQINSFINDGQLVFSVTNDGNTLDKEDLPRLFKRFYQTSKNSEGVGVGLALVKELATLSHGQVIAQISDPDLIQFTLTIPIERSYYNRSELRESPSDLLEVDEMNEALALNPDDIIGDEKPLLLVVEDDAEIRRYIQSIFEKDYKLIKAADGKSGCEKAINQIPDLIISDIMMPGMDGLELSSTLKLDERTSHIPIILLTAKSGDEHEMEGLKTGADAYVTKPFRAANLKIRVDQLIDLRRKLRQRYDQEADVNPKELSLSTADQRFFERLQKILDTQLTDPQFNADRFASEMAMSRMQLHRKLKALTGLSSSEFIRSQRIKMAVKILKTREVSVSELAYDIGFNTPSYFIKCFKEALGQTPLEYQKRS